MKTILIGWSMMLLGKACNPSIPQTFKAFAFASVMQGGAPMVDDEGNPIQQPINIQRMLLLVLSNQDTTGFWVDSILLKNLSVPFSMVATKEPPELVLESGKKWTGENINNTSWYQLTLGYGIGADIPPGKATYQLFWRRNQTSGVLSIEKEYVLQAAEGY